jgi:hypothetical protein
MAVEHDRLADLQNAREPVTLARAQRDAVVAYAAATAEFPGFADDELCSKIFGAIPHALTLTIPSDEATKQVNGALEGFDLLVRLLTEHVATLQRRQTMLGTKKRPRNADYARYVLILDLVRLFEGIFQQPAKITREGACCQFLSAVLSRCEGKELDPDGAYDSWRKARRWLAC